MKTTTLRNRFAAVLLLAPVAAAVLVARPAHAQQYAITVTTPAVVAVQDRDFNRGWERGQRHDNRAPRITDVTPDDGGRVSERGITQVSARFHDRGGSGIDARGITLRVDGRDVTRRAAFDGDSVAYRENLQPGRHHAELVVRDRAGNITRETWSFLVTPRHGDRGDRYGYYNGR